MLNLTMTTQEIELMNRINRLPAQERAQQLVILWMLANRRQSVLNQIDWLDDQAEEKRISAMIETGEVVDDNDLVWFAGRSHPQ